MYRSPMQLDVFPTDVQMRRIDPARNMRRILSNERATRPVRSRQPCARIGRIGFRGQMMMVETHPDEGRAIAVLMKIAAA